MQFKLEKYGWITILMLVIGSIIGISCEAKIKQSGRTIFAQFMQQAMPSGASHYFAATAPSLFANQVVTNLNNSGTGSLRQAIASAVSGDTITFQAGLTGTITLANELVIDKNLTITGSGAATIKVSGNNTVRVFHISTGVTATISGLTITQGKDGLDGGGGIFNEGTLALNNCTVTGNVTTVRGGGIYSPGAITISGCTITNNAATNNGGASVRLGGGILLNSTATIQDSTFSGNSAEGGGAISISSAATPVSILRCNINKNISSLGGAGISISNSQTADSRQVTIEQTTIAENTAGSGAGISAGGANVTLKNCTISGNTATASGTAGGGGGVNRSVGTMTFINCTVVNNRVVVSTGTYGYGGGIASYPISTTTGLTLKNTIVASNTASFGTDMYLFYGFSSAGNNLIGNTQNAGGTIASDLVNVNPQLFPLGNYGGIVPTHLTKPDSPAINAGQDTTIAPDNLTIDARNIPRKLGSAVDIGAVENPQSLTFSPTSIPAGTTGVAYNQTLTAAGGNNFAIAAGTLPLGVTLSASGTLSGTPLESGTFNFTVAAADANGYRNAISYSLSISPVAPIAGRLNALSMPSTSTDIQYVRFTEAQSPQVTGYTALTIEAWVKPGSATGRYDILNRWPIFFNIQDGKPALYLNGLGNPGYYLASSALNANVWSHVAVTWDGTQIQFYINGISSGTFAVTGALTNLVKQPLSLGYCIECGPGGGFFGGLDEIRLWSVARTQSQIQANQYLGLTGLTALENGLEAYWRFDETSGTTVTDATGHGYNGTINNFVTRVTSDHFLTNEDTVYNGNLFGYQKYGGAPLTYALVTQGSKGTVSVNPNTGAFTYTPNLNANGTDSFTYKVNNGLDASPTTMSVSINPVADAPDILPVGTIYLSQGDSMTNTTIATVSDLDNAAHGSLTVTVSAAFPGITLSNLVNTNGVITANVAIDCTARIGDDPAQLTVSNGSLTATAFVNFRIGAGTPVITTQPVSLSKCEGNSASFSVAATGMNLTYQWRKNGVNIGGVTSSTYSIPSIAAGDAGDYSAVITNGCGASVTSTPATLNLAGTNAGTLGNYGTASVIAGGNTSVIPDAVPAGAANGTFFTVAASGNFSGGLSVHPTTGVVTVTNAPPTGTYTVTVTATPPCGNSITKTFALNVWSPPACADANFSGTTNINVGNSPYSVATADFNGDGNLDLATANASSSSVSIRLGDGTGNFSGTTNVSVGNSTASVVTGDFNHDGKFDFAAANYGSGSVSIRLGDGTGNFSGTTNVNVGSGVIAVATGDFNGDGNLDIVAVLASNNTAAIRLGDGAGNFSGTTSLSVGNRPTAVATGDFNGDNQLDIAVANELGRTVSIRLGDGLGNFSGTTEISVGYSPESIATADFNQDGKLDFAVANYGENAVSIRLGNGAGNFSGTTKISVGTHPYAVVVNDFNGDGKLDFVAANYDSNTASIRLGDGAGSFSGTTNINVGTMPYAIAAGDFNNDGRPDFATANSGSNNVSIRLNSCNTPPTITATNGLSQPQGTTANVNIAKVSDLETVAGSLTVTALTVPTGLTLTDITNTNGNITAALTIAPNAPVGNQAIGLQVSDGSATTSAILYLQITATSPSLPTITAHPAAQSVAADSNATFSVAGTNYTTLQWQVSINGGQFWTPMAGAIAPALTIPVRSTHNGNRYRAVLTNASGSVVSGDALLTVTGNSTNAAATGLVIREFRLRGNASSLDPAQDEYIELHNLTTSNLTVNNGGWAIVALAADGNSLTTLATIPNGTVIPAKSHYLVANPNGYSLGALATSDLTFTTNIADDSGIAIFNSPSIFNATTLIDAVGFQSTGTQASLLREGTGLANLGATNGEYAWVRKMTNGQAVDTGDNTNDFVLVIPAGTNVNGVTARLGAPSPNNRVGTIEMNSQIIQSLLDPLILSNATPNQVRDLAPVTNGTFGTLVLRRSYTNHSGARLSQLRFRLIDITNDPAGLEADLRVLNSITATIDGKVVEGLTIEPVPAQPNGGGLNAVFAVGRDLPIGATINIEFKLGVMRRGKFRFILNIEARP